MKIIIFGDDPALIQEAKRQAMQDHPGAQIELKALRRYEGQKAQDGVKFILAAPMDDVAGEAPADTEDAPKARRKAK